MEFLDAILMTDWNAIHYYITLHFISTEIPDDPQTNDELYFFSKFLNQRSSS